MHLDQPTIASITRHAVRLYGEGLYVVRVTNGETTLETADGEVLYRAHPMGGNSGDLETLERLLARRAERLS